MMDDNSFFLKFILVFGYKYRCIHYLKVKNSMEEIRFKLWFSINFEQKRRARALKLFFLKIQ